ncbi:MAG TPA: FtsX-like permease family protein [Polyangiaceae bacterium]|nr:FtsX-like permease family protein [Polyangiaceae bacterium]
MIWRLALRNTLRNRRRTLLASVAISLSFALLLVFLGIGDGVHEAMAEVGVSMGLGHLIVDREGFSDDPSLEHSLPEPARLRTALLRLPWVRQVAPRLRTDALITAGATSVGVALSGVEPSIEPLISKIDTPRSMVAGHALAPPDGTPARSEPAPIVVGKELARTLDVQVGDRVTLTVRPRGGGETHSGAYRVHGIFATGVHDIDAYWSEIPIQAARELTGSEQAATSLAVFLDNVAETTPAKAQLQTALAGEHVEVLSWMQAAPDLYSFIVVDQGGLYAMMGILFVVVAAGILNTLLMGVMERTGEFGLLLAVGATPRRVVAIVLAEAAILGAVAVGAGLALGLTVNHYFSTTGIDLSGMTGEGYETSGVLLPTHFYAHLYPAKLVWSAVLIVGLVLLGACYPALRAGRLQPVEAIRHE